MDSRLLPLFPLPLVLFPGAALPLHVFEPRYRRLLADCLAADRRFGIVLKPDGVAERDLPAGHVGCVALVTQHEPLEDGRSNILVRGVERFALVRFVESDAPYHVGEVTDVADDAESALVQALVADDVRAIFARIVQAIRTISGEPGPVPPLPEEPDALAFAIAAMVELDAGVRQRLLATRSSRQRLEELRGVLAGAAEPLEVRAAVSRHRASPEAGGEPGLELGA